LEAGKKADVVMFDATRPEWRPLYHPVSNLVFAADGHSVDTVIIDGAVVMENGRVLTIDEEHVMHEIEKAGQRVLKQTGWEVPSRWPVIR
jgi:cytosine/adenosine deaminase-related metal-dependent hydrolase